MSVLIVWSSHNSKEGLVIKIIIATFDLSFSQPVSSQQSIRIPSSMVGFVGCRYQSIENNLPLSPSESRQTKPPSLSSLSVTETRPDPLVGMDTFLNVNVSVCPEKYSYCGIHKGSTLGGKANAIKFYRLTTAR